MRAAFFCAGYVIVACALTVASTFKGGAPLGILCASSFTLISAMFIGWRSVRQAAAEKKLLEWIDRFAVSPTAKEAIDSDLLREWPRVAQHLAWGQDHIREKLENLSRAQTQQQRVVHYMIDGVIVVSANGHVVSANPAARRLMGFSIDATQAKPLVDIIRVPEIVSAVNQVLSEGKNQEVTVKVGTREGRTLRVQATLLPDEPQKCVLLTLHDETRLRALEQLRREFVANVSHELKTPLASVKGYAETLLLGALEEPERAKRFVEHIAQQSERLEMLINDMLSLARAQAAPEVISISRVSALEIINQSVAAYLPVAERKPVRIVVDPISSELCAAADRESLLTVVNNLVGNAVRYTQANGEIHISAKQDGHWCLVKVADNGPGIPPADQERVFERFYRVEKARDARTGGTGLGLAIAKNLMLNMQGSIHVKSQPGQGSEFEIRLPIHTGN